MRWGPRLSKKKKANSGPASLSLFPVCECHMTWRLTLLIQSDQPPHAPDTMCPAPHSPDTMWPAASCSWYNVSSLLRLLIQCDQSPLAPATLPTLPRLYCPLELWGGTNLSFLKLLLSGTLSQQRDKYLMHHLSISGGRWNTSIQINSRVTGACHQNTLAVTNRMPLVSLVQRRERGTNTLYNHTFIYTQ